MRFLTSSQLTRLSKRLLKAAGASEEEASIVATALVDANLAGVDSHGVFPYLISYVHAMQKKIIRTGTRFEIVKETPCTALLNGNWGFGQVICTKAMQLAIRKAKKNGVAAIGIFNCNSIGRLAYFANMATRNGMIGFITSNSDPNVAPYGGRKAVLSTNPISYSIPAGQEKPIVVDFATSVVSEGKIRAALYEGKTFPANWIIDSRGRPSRNPADLYDPPLPPERVKMAGAILTAGGYKGYGLSLVVEALAGGLTGSGCDGEVTSSLTNGVFITVLRIANFVSTKQFTKRIDRLIRCVKSSPVAFGVSEILIPGERSYKEARKRSKSGVPISEKAWGSLIDVCREYGLDAESLVATKKVR